METTNPKAQPEPCSGLVRVANGVWYEAAMRKLDNLDATELTWVAFYGRLVHVATANKKSVAKIHRMRREFPWNIRVDGFMFWSPPGRVIKHWHYTQSIAMNDLRAAKKLVAAVIAGRHQSNN